MDAITIQQIRKIVADVRASDDADRDEQLIGHLTHAYPSRRTQDN